MTGIVALGQAGEKRGLQLIVLIPAKNAIAEPDSARMYVKAAEHPRQLVRCQVSPGGCGRSLQQLNYARSGNANYSPAFLRALRQAGAEIGQQLQFKCNIRA